MKKNKIILLTILIMLVLYCGAVVFVTKPDGFDLSSLFVNNVALSEESKADLKAELKEELKSELKAELKEELKAELSAELKEELSAELSEQISEQVEDRATITKEDYDSIREQVRTEKIDEVLSKLED